MEEAIEQEVIAETQGDEEGGIVRPVDGPEGMSTPLSGEDGAAATPQSRSHGSEGEVGRLRGELEGARSRWLESHRRALLAENHGRVVPELVVGSTVEELEQSLEVARGAFEAARKAALAEISATQVPTGNPVRQGPRVEEMSSLEKIAHGLKRE